MASYICNPPYLWGGGRACIFRKSTSVRKIIFKPARGLLPFILIAPAIFASGNARSNPGDQSLPPYKRKPLFDTSAHLETDSSSITSGKDKRGSALGGNIKPDVAGSYVITMHFDPITGLQNEGAALEGALIPPPVAGKAPILLVREGGWIGKIQWRKIGANGLVHGSAPSIFEAGSAYIAQVKWAPASQFDNENAEKIVAKVGASEKPGVVVPLEIKNPHNLTEGANTLPRGNLPHVISPQAGAGKVVTVVAKPPFQDVAKSSVVAYGSGAVSPETHEPLSTPRQITLPDLGGEADTSKSQPVKKPYNPEQAYANSQMGFPYGTPGSPMATPPFGAGAPNAGVGARPGVNNAPGVSGVANPMGMPGINVGDAGAGANITPTATDIRFESTDYLGHVGINYVSPKSSYGVGIKADGAYLLGKTAAIGANLLLNNNMKEAVLSGVWMPEGTNLKAKLSTSYMVGQQNFDFYSGNANANLSQASYYFSTQYVVPKEQSSYLHNVGISTWGSKAKQTNNPDPVYVLSETASAYQLMMDPRKLAVGTLQGEALDAQVGITKQIIAKAAVGYETLKFPFSDGSQELDKRIYQDYVLQYQPVPEVALQAGYKMGAAMNNIMLSAAYSRWKVTGFKNNGVNGVAGNQGAMLTYSLPLDGTASKAVSFGTLTRPELIGNSSYIMRDAATRPVQLPQAFLAKVDTTAVKTLATIDKAGLPAGATVNAAGDVQIPVGVSGGSVTQVTRNGAPYSNSSAIQMTGSGLIIRPKLLPAAAANGDSYVISVTDSSATSYLVRVATQN